MNCTCVIVLVSYVTLYRNEIFTIHLSTDWNFHQNWCCWLKYTVQSGNYKEVSLALFPIESNNFVPQDGTEIYLIDDIMSIIGPAHLHVPWGYVKEECVWICSLWWHEHDMYIYTIHVHVHTCTYPIHVDVLTFSWKFLTSKIFDQRWILVWAQNFGNYNFEHAHQLGEIKNSCAIRYCGRIACALAYPSTHACAKVVIVPTFLSCNFLTNTRDCGISVLNCRWIQRGRQRNGRAWKLSTRQNLEKW